MAICAVNGMDIIMKNLMKITAFTLITVLLFTGCAAKNEASVSQDPSKETTTKPEEKTLLRIGMMSSSDAIPFALINEKGLGDKYQLELQLETFTAAKDRDAALQAGELDGVLTDYIGVCMYQNASFDVRITGITDGDYILMAGKNTGITDISQIKGRSIAISENTLIDYTLDKILQNNSLTGEDVVKEIVPRIPDRLELLRNDKIDLGLMPEPFATIALKDGAVSLGSANELGLYPAVSAFTMEALEEKTAAIHNLYLAYNEAVEYMNKTDLSEYEETVIEAVGYPEEMKGKIEVRAFRTSTLPSREEVEEAIAWASTKGLCSADLTYDQLVYDVSTK